MGIWKVVGLSALFWTATAAAHDNKRIDACGCHHQYGLRHCHPKKKSNRCEAPVNGAEKATTTDARSQKPEGPKNPIPEVIRI